MKRVDSEQMRSAILDAVVTCKAEAEGTDISLAQVACRAGISERTLARYFPDKEMMLYHGAILYLSRIYQQSAMAFAQLDVSGLNGYQKLLLLLNKQVERNELDMHNTRVFVRAYTTALRTAVCRNLPVAGYDAPVRNLVLSFVELGVKDGSIRADAEPMNIYFMLASNYMGLVQRLIYFYSVDYTKEEHNKKLRCVFRQYTDMVSMYLAPKNANGGATV